MPGLVGIPMTQFSPFYGSIPAIADGCRSKVVAGASSFCINGWVKNERLTDALTRQSDGGDMAEIEQIMNDFWNGMISGG